jgi:hypothetical protein
MFIKLLAITSVMSKLPFHFFICRVECTDCTAHPQKLLNAGDIGMYPLLDCKGSAFRRLLHRLRPHNSCTLVPPIIMIRNRINESLSSASQRSGSNEPALVYSSPPSNPPEVFYVAHTILELLRLLGEILSRKLSFESVLPSQNEYGELIQGLPKLGFTAATDRITA